MSDKQLRDYLLYNAYCKKHYQMDACAKFAMMRLSCKTFKEKLLHNTTLSDGAVLELLNDYLHGCNTNKQKYKDLEQQVKEAIKVRNQFKVSQVAKELERKIAEQKMQVEQELRLKLLARHKQSIEQQHQAVQDLYWVNDYVSDEIEQAREEALQQTEAEDYIQYDQSYTLDAITCGYLSYQYIAYLDYLHCYGTALQQQYHQEICDILTQAAHQHLKIENLLQSQFISPVLEHATNFAQAAQQTNQKDWTSVTGALASIGMLCVDLCKEFYSRPLDYARAIQEGVIESVYDFGHMMLRLDEAIYSVGQMLYFVLETGAMTEAALCFPESNMTALQERHGQISAALSAMQQDFFNKDGPARVKAITKFGTDFYLPAKLTHAVGYLIGGISSRARGMRSLEGVSSLFDESLITAETAEKIREIEVVIEQGFTQKVAAEFMEADSTIAKAGNIAARPLKVLIDEIKIKYNGVIPSHCKMLRKEFKDRLKLLEQELRSFKLEQIKKIHGSKRVNNKKVDIALEHICNFQLKLEHRNIFGGYVLEITGGHLPGVCEDLANTGLVKIVNKNRLSTGVTDYILQNCLTGEIFSKPKTVFPLGWTEEKIVKSVWTIYEDPLLKVEKTGSGKFFKVGTIENINIQVLWSEKGKSNQVLDFIHTMYPINGQV
ncbi:MAG: hypothetical protein CL947_00385 [Epsilonproteobacteria bacterium]|nr:hypothetical protein [Campylobacterota bacterium]